MTLTKAELIDIWSALQAIEYDMIHFPYSRYSGPYILRQQNEVVKNTLNSIRLVKGRIHSQIEISHD